MRLLQRDDRGHFHLTKELGRETPPYAILSHTWAADEDEVTFQDIQHNTGHNKTGFRKLEFSANQAAQDGFSVFWCDTCCIDKSNSTELAEAINSMFQWYRDAAVCYVYLQDVINGDTESPTDMNTSEPSWAQAFRQCRWLSRGWTLQELIAPKSVVFFDAKGQRLGDKEVLIDFLEQTTAIPAAALRGRPLSTFSIEELLSWRGSRQTKRDEDRVYSMLGIFDVYLPLLYGEGEQRAESRLLEEVHKRSRGYYDNFSKAANLRSSNSLGLLAIRTEGGRGYDLTHEPGIDEVRDLFNAAKAQCEMIAPEADFGIQSTILLSQFEADKRLFYQWGEDIDIHTGDRGLEPSSATASAAAAGALRETLLQITKALSISNVSNPIQKRMEQLDTRPNPTMSFVDVVLQVSQVKAGQKSGGGNHLTPSPLKRKMRFVAFAQQFRALVEELYNLTCHDYINQTLLMHAGTWWKIGGLTEISSQFQAQKLVWEEIKRQTQREMRQELEIWLNAVGPNAMYDDVLQKRLIGTCCWIFERTEFQQWKLEVAPGGHAKLLWITGPAGYGKTVLSGGIIQHLQDLALSPFYFFFSADLEDRSDPFIVLRSWVLQLVSTSQDAFDVAWEDLEAHVAREASRRQVVALFKRLVVRVPNCVFVVDGLDECTQKAGWADLDNRSLASFVLAVVEAIGGSTSRVLIVSREQQDIRDGLSSISSETSLLDFTEYKISEEDVQPDATLLSRSIVGRKLSNKPQAFQDEIAQKIVQKSNSMLLHIKLLESDLRGGKNQNQLERILSQAPNKLATLYDRNWQRIMDNDTDRSRALAILRWATFAQRSITVYEITEALLAAEDDVDASLQDNMPDAIDEEFVKTEILDLCHSLVEARVTGSSRDIGSRTIHLTHFTVREYLLQRDPVTGAAIALQANDALHRAHESEHHMLLADTCLRYLKVSRIWAVDADQQQDYRPEDRIDQGYLRDYAATFWRWHIRFESPQYSQVLQSIIDFFCACDPAWGYWRRHLEETPMTSSHVKYKGELSSPNRLFYATNLGLRDLVHYMVEQRNADVNAVDASNRTALLAAAAQGHVLLTGYLLEKGADVDITGENMDTPLMVACRLGHLEVVRQLVEAAPQYLDSIRNEATPLFMATSQRHVDVVKFLLGKGADPNVTSWEGWAPLHCAAWKGYLEIVEMLLDQGTDPNLPTGARIVALAYAAEAGHTEVVKLLLCRGADHNAKDMKNRTALWGASLGGHDSIVKLLLDRGADHDSICGEYESTALEVAASAGHMATVQLLLDKGADYNTATKEGWTPLSGAALNGHADVVELLIDRGADYTIATAHGRTPLAHASSSGRFEVVKLLIQRGADYNTVTDLRWTPVNFASESGHIDIVRYLLDLGADFSLPTIHGFSPLINAVLNGHIDILELLLDRGADCVHIKASGRSALAIAAVAGHTEIIKLLLLNGADHAAPSVEGWTPLGYAAVFEHAEVIKLLLEAGADINAPFSNTGSLLHWAATVGRLKMANILLEAGADQSLTDEQGATALRRAALNGHLDVAKLLIDNGAKFDINTDDGLELWGQSASKGSVDMLKLLIRHNDGISPIPAKAVSSPLHLAASSGHLETMQLLLDTGASLTAREETGDPPLHYAAYYGHSEAVRLLIENGANVPTENDLGRTALFYAGTHKFQGDISLLLHDTTDVNKPDIYGATPLAVAAHFGQRDAVEYLLSLPEVDVCASDHFGRTALSWARRGGFTGIVELLKNRMQITELPTDGVHSENEWASAPDCPVGSRYCDVCLGTSGGMTFHCDICCAGEFDICQYCKGAGAHCLDQNHNLTERSIG